jgi:aminoglycoside phosphotransferase (APT) family kinase protein
VGRDAIAALLQRHHLPQLDSVEPMSGGEANSTLLLNGELVLRLNRGDPHLPRLAKEATIYRRLRRSTDVPCPEVLALDTAHDLVPYDALILSRVAGVSGATVWGSLDDDTREALSEEAGRMCGSIHGLQWPAYGDFDAATRTFGQYPRWTDLLLARLEQIAEQARATGALPSPLIDAVLTELNDSDSVFGTASRPTLVHNDLRIRHMLLEQRDGTWHITAILGWERAFTADAAWEFADLWNRRPAEDLLGDAFLYGYRERHAVQADLRSRIHLYRLMRHLERAVIAHTHFAAEPERRLRHERALRKLLRGYRG